MESYHFLLQRCGVTPDLARSVVRTNTTAIAAIMVSRGEAESMICGTFGEYLWHLKYVKEILAVSGLHPAGALSMMILEDGPLFVGDTQIYAEPEAEQIANIVVAAARHTRRFGIEPKIALCSHSQFGNLDSGSGVRMRSALRILDSELIQILKIAEKQGKLLRIEGNLIFTQKNFLLLKDKVNDYFKKNVDMSIPQFKELAQTSRKYAVPLLEYFDKLKITYRDGNSRKLVK